MIYQSSRLMRLFVDYQLSEYLSRNHNCYEAKHRVILHDTMLNAPVITIRGTRHASDWLENLNCTSIKLSDGNVHSGYYENANTIYSEVEDVLSKCPKKKLYLTGYSSGACKAIIIGFLLSKKYDLNVHVTTFGIPIFCDEKFLLEIHKTKNLHIRSYALEDDVVMKLGLGMKIPSIPLEGSRVDYHDSMKKRIYALHDLVRYKQALKLQIVKFLIGDF